MYKIVLTLSLVVSVFFGCVARNNDLPMTVDLWIGESGSILNDQEVLDLSSLNDDEMAIFKSNNPGVIVFTDAAGAKRFVWYDRKISYQSLGVKLLMTPVAVIVDGIVVLIKGSGSLIK